MDLLGQLAFVSPPLVAGLLSRGVALSFLIAFASLYPQLIPIAGRRGLTPIHDALRAIERDFPTRKRYLYFPTLLWFGSSDRALRSLGGLGIVAALLALVGGPATPVCFALCWLSLLSLDRAMTLIYPWDSALFEAGFWAIFLPPTQLSADLAAVSGCEPPVLWVYRLLLFRVLLGFGKHKFVGSTAQDNGFLYGFFATQPLPTRLGWLAQKSPMWLLKLALLAMFVIEVPLPFAIFFPGPWSALLGLSSIGLMVAIWLCGNFGYFNVVAVVISLACFDSESAAHLSLFSPAKGWDTYALDALFVLHTTIAAVAFPFNTFCSHTWMMWSPWLRVPMRWLCAPVTLARALHPFRFAHAYGVFSPQSGPDARITAVAEVTWDGSTWHELVHPFWPTQEGSTPKFCAPHHERFDQAIVYESIGLNESSPYRNIIGRWDPYGHGGLSSARMFMHRVLSADLPGSRFYDRSMERRWGPPQAVRVRSYILEPASIQELRTEGRWWRRTLIGPHYAPLQQGEGYWDEPMPEPELWHYDDLFWLKRSRLGTLLRRAASGESADALVKLGAVELTDKEIEVFWSKIVPVIHSRHDASFVGLRTTVCELRETYGAQAMRRFERMANRYALCLFARLEPMFLRAGWSFLRVRWRPDPATNALAVRSYYELRTLCMAVVAQGRQTYREVLDNPELAHAQAEQLTMPRAHQLQFVFRYETMVFHAQKLRLLDNMSRQLNRTKPDAKKQELMSLAGNAFGAVPMIEFLKTQFLAPEDWLDVPERWPRFEVTSNLEVRRVINADSVRA